MAAKKKKKPPPPFKVRDGVSQPVFSFGNAIRETVWVETGLDRDRDSVKA